MNEELYFFTYKKSGLALENSQLEQAEIAVLGIPFDSTQTGGTGSRHGPTSIRLASYELEHYDFNSGTDLSDLRICDIGDIDTIPGSPVDTKERIDYTMSYFPKEKFLLGLGGEHSVTLPLVEALSPDCVISFDAHPDLRDEYMGITLSHSSVMRRVHEKDIAVTIIGVREGSKEEHDYATENNITIIPPQNITDCIDLPKDKRVYISIDLDVFEGYINVGNPVPGGPTFNQICTTIETIFKYNKVCGIDIVELCSQGPDNSAMIAAKLLFKILSYYKKYL